MAQSPRRWAPVVYLLVTAAAVPCAAALLWAWSQGLRYGSTSPALALPLAAAVIAFAAASWWTAVRTPGTVARWTAATCACLLAYLAGGAGAALYTGLGGQRDALALLFLWVHGPGAQVPVAVLQLCLAAVAARIAPGAVPLRAFAWTLLPLSAVHLVTAVLLIPHGPPFADVRPPVDLPALEVPAVVLGTLVWVVPVLAGPVLVWRAAARSRGRARRRLSLVAACALTPVVTIVFCVVGMSLADPIGLLGTTAAEGILAVAYCVPFLVAAAGIPLTLWPAPEERVLLLVPRVVSGTVAVVVSLLFAIVVVTLGTAAGVGFGDGAPLAVALVTLAATAASTPLRTRLTRRLTLAVDPGRATAARLVRGRVDRSRPGPEAQRILRASLADPAVRLLLRLPEGRGWVDAEDRPVDPVPAGVDAGTAAARVVHDGEPGDAAGAVAELRDLVDRAVLAAAVRDQAERLTAERERADRAAAQERHRLERDLHDGVQGRLLALALDLRMAQRALADDAARAVVSDAAEGLREAVEELRALASGSAPLVLARDGLGPALADLARRSPVPVEVTVPGPRLPPGTETVAYLVVCEAVTNALKHARARRIAVRVTAADGTASVEVVDDGRGGADLRAGTGLRGLSERVGSVGGRLLVSDSPTGGTRVEVSLPCGS
ncbi:sensor histidine kinase [Nocardiopsis protaetiae]|uniref:sensor histidine kinase n=1 Tax=Nocardiopsis protaetiae TaxID=3382270 RepID=UPI00387B1176